MGGDYVCTPDGCGGPSASRKEALDPLYLILRTSLFVKLTEPLIDLEHVPDGIHPIFGKLVLTPSGLTLKKSMPADASSTPPNPPMFGCG